MSNIAFAAEVIENTQNVVARAFDQAVLLRNETKDKVTIPAGRVAIIANYHGYAKGAPGKPARWVGQAVLNLAAVSRLTEAELNDLITQLEDLSTNIDQGVKAAEAMG